MSPKFDVMMVGYDIHEVDALVSAVDSALNTRTKQTRQAALDALHDSQSEGFRRRLRGYSTLEVDN